jgi:hypothetical protein
MPDRRPPESENGVRARPPVTNRRPRRALPRAPRRESEQHAAQAANEATTPDQEAAHLTGVVGDQSAATSRSGEDTRRRGWFWHWNSIVTQYAPLIGLKGVGLLNSYTVWTDRREESPHRGYAFPSQQSEADFYGEDRAELITINKILVALDLIEIRKEMVLRTDERGRRWRVPHNFYRVKDHDDDFTLTTRDVMAVVALADRDKSVYRYVRRIFSPRFAPIDSENVWGRIVAELRDDPTWQRLAVKTTRDEDRASARSRAGHVSRREGGRGASFSPKRGDTATPEVTVGDRTNDSATGAIKTVGETSVAMTNTGSMVDVGPSNSGLTPEGPTSAAPTNKGRATSVAASNRTYHQEHTTTTTDQNEIVNNGSGSARDARPGSAGVTPPDETRDEDLALRRFEEANSRRSTPAERRLLRTMAEQFGGARGRSYGWRLLVAAIDDAVAAGSAFVAPRRIREILSRWARDGAPVEYADLLGVAEASEHGARPGSQTATQQSPRAHHAEARRADAASREVLSRRSASEAMASVAALPEPPSFTIAECGLTNRQVWSAVLDTLRGSGEISRSDIDTWLRDAAIVGRGDGGAMIIGAPHALAQRRITGGFKAPLRRALAAITGHPLELEVALLRDWLAPGGDPSAAQRTS